MKKIIFFLLIFALALGVSPALAEETTEVSEVTQVAEEVLAELDSVAEITTADLGNVKTGWFSGVWRNVKLWTTNDPLKKADLELAKANVELLKAKKLVQEKSDDPKLQARLEKANTKYAGLMEKVRTRLSQAQENNPDNPKLDKFFDVFTDQQFKHQQLLERLEGQVPAAVAEKIKTQRQQHLEKFGEVMNKLQTKEELKARIINSLGDESVDIKHRIMRVKYIENLEELSPELKDKIEAAKVEGEELWSVMKDKHDMIIKSRQDLRANIKAQLEGVDPEELTNNPEARQELMQSIREEAQEVRTTNTQIRTEAREQVKTFRETHQPLRQEVKNEVKPILKNKIQDKVNTVQ